MKINRIKIYLRDGETEYSIGEEIDGVGKLMEINFREDGFLLVFENGNRTILRGFASAAHYVNDDGIDDGSMKMNFNAKN